MKEERPELFALAGRRLSRTEQANIWLIQRSFRQPLLNEACLWAQKHLGAGWVDFCTRRLRETHGLDRLPPLDQLGNFLVVANHRSYFDLFVISMILFRAGLEKRILFPVRSNYFYDQPLGFAVNGLMSFWSMYPPVFRDRKRAALNHTAFSEIIWALKHDHAAAGMHPEGTRNQSDDPYRLLPAKSGVGRIIHEARTPVLPVFINGLGNDLPQQVLGNFSGRGERVIVVFGAPIDFGDKLNATANAKTYRALATACNVEIERLGEEERALRTAPEC